MIERTFVVDGQDVPGQRKHKLNVERIVLRLRAPRVFHAGPKHGGHDPHHLWVRENGFVLPVVLELQS